MAYGVVVWVISQDEWALTKLSKESSGAPVLGRFVDGSQQWVRAQSIQFRSSHTWNSETDHKQLREHSQRVHAFLDEAKRQLKDLWSMLHEDESSREGEFDLYELGSFLSGPAEPAFQDAVLRALIEDQVFFKRRTERWRLRSRSSVEENLKRLSKNNQREERERPWLNAILRAMRGEDLDVQEATYLKEACALIEGVVLHPPDSAQHVRGKSLLRRLTGTDQIVTEDHALEVLVRLGFYDEDENLDLRRHKITLAFSDELNEEGRRLCALQDSTDDAKPLSLRSYAIDSRHTRDIDDAIAIKQVNNGFEVHILISNLARFLPLDSSVTTEAARRGSTLYLPQGQVPMLPKALSEDALSLQEGSARHVIDFCVQLNHEGVPYDIKIDFVQTDRVQQLTYEEVDKILATKGESDANLVHEDIRLLGRLAEKIRSLRKERGALFVQPPQFNTRVDQDGQIDVERIDQNGPARSMVSEYMILCGHMTARYCSERSIPIVYRLQPPSGADFSALSGQDISHSKMMNIIRQMKPARVSKEPGVHSGLGVSAYCRVTSPIRRFSDFLLIAQIRHHIQAGGPLIQKGALMQMVKKDDALVRRNNQIMRAANNYWILKLYQQKLQEEVAARVINEDGQRVQIYMEQTGFVTTTHTSTPPTEDEVISVKIVNALPRQNRLVVKL